ncbi:MAG TPA: sulfite exporter TauE/SafE family protein [Brumimicrobium sp.]|nr:sulfite exporter TauE/SafE family protein [Brumimicrobium sp.]
MEFLTIYILSVTFIATLVRSTFGFGEALVAVPLLAFHIPIEIAVPFSVLVSIFIAAFVLVQDRKKVHFYSAKWLILFAVLGIPFGLLILIYGNESIVKLGLGIFIVLYSVYSLFGKHTFKLATDNKFWLFIFGFLSGVLGGSYGFNGPPIVIYGNLRSWTAKHFRATLQAYFLPAGILGMIGFWYNELWTSTVTYYFIISFPVVIPAIILGRNINQKLKDDTFLKYVYLGLLCVGVMLLGQSIL